ncbi:MAG: NADH-quinone oxidoreductase subunit NuoE [Peptococcaceae bacterium]|nr:NADH-quinone oxidoreductase subunit NuoE [Peptococcaceae bacterium]
MQLTEEERKEAVEKSREILARYDGSRGGLIPALQQIQDVLGYVPAEAMREAAGHFGMPAVDVYGVVTFYNQFRLTPPGRHQVKVCMGTACHMKGGNIIMESWERVLKVKVGETTPDREFSLERVACVGCCTMAPVALVNETVHGKMTPTKVDGLYFSHQLANQQKKEGMPE